VVVVMEDPFLVMEDPPPQPPAVQRQASRGTCRLCFDDGGDLMAPCLCKGTSRWIHRECLDRWRVSGSNPRALTNCCECGFQYHLVLQRCKDSDVDARQREFLHTIGAQTIMAFLGVQAAIVVLGMLIRTVDTREVLVKALRLPQEPGQTVPGDFWNAMNHHKSTYYLAGFLSLAAIVGFLSLCSALFAACNRPSYLGGGGGTTMDIYTGHVCGQCCGDCCTACCRCNLCCSCPGMSGTGLGAGMNMSGGGDAAGGACAVFCLFILVILIFVGIFMALISVVLAIQESVKKYAQIQQLRMLAGEYVVEDLARDEPETTIAAVEPQSTMIGAAQLPPPSRTDEHEAANQQIVQDLETLFGRGPGQRPSQSYGSV